MSLLLLLLVNVTALAETKLKVTELANGLARPWAVAQLPDGSLLITERKGQLRWFNNGALSGAINGLPRVYNAGQGGMLDVKPHPDFVNNNLIYFTYGKGNDKNNATYLGKAKFKDGQLTEVSELFKAEPNKENAYHYSGRLEFLPDGTLVFAVGDGYFYKDKAQELDNHFGKVIRLNDDGSVPANNPFVGQANVKPEIYSYGHRNPQGMFYDVERKLLFSNEHGPKGGDEINVITPALNYGWPAITYGVDYSGDIISELTHKEGMEQPLLQWTPSIAPSSLLVYYGREFPEFNGDILTTTLKYQELRLVELSGDKNKIEVKGQKTFLKNEYGRLRDIEIGKAGELYLVTDAGLLLKLTKG